MYECQKLLVHAVEFKGEMTSFKIGPFLKPASEFRVCVCECACVRACVCADFDKAGLELPSSLHCWLFLISSNGSLLHQEAGLHEKLVKLAFNLM